MSTGQPNVRSSSYRKQLEQLPDKIKEAADDAFRLFLQDPFHPLLENHELHDHRRGRHKKASRAVSVTRRYRVPLEVIDVAQPCRPTEAGEGRSPAGLAAFVVKGDFTVA